MALLTSLSMNARKLHRATASLRWESFIPCISVGFFRAFMSSTGDTADMRFSSGTYGRRKRAKDFGLTSLSLF